MTKHCYFCNKELDGTSGFCVWCDSMFWGITHVYTCYTNNILDFAAFTYENEYRIYINFMKNETIINANTRDGWQAVLTVPGEPLNFKNIKDKLPTYFTFS